MKKMKKVFAILVAMVMVIAMAVPAMADDDTSSSGTSTGIYNVTNVTGTSSSADRGTITVTGYTTGTPTAYRVIGATYSEEGYFVEYTSLVNGLVLTENTTTHEITMNMTAAELTEMIVSGDINVESYTDLSSLPVGGYIIIIKDTTDANVYNAMMGSVYYNPDDNGTTILGTKVSAKYTSGPDKGKTIAKIDGVSVNGGATVTVDVAVGSTLTFDIYGSIPEYDLDAYEDLTYTFKDTLGTGLDYVEDSMSVVSPTGTTIAAVGDSAVNGQNITIEMTDAEVRANVGKTIHIQYEAKITEESLASGNFNPTNNTLTIEYSNGPDTTATTTPVETHQYTFDIDENITKVDTDGNELAGAKFGLYTTDADGAKSSLYVYPDGTEAYYTTLTDGDIEFLGIPAGTYVLEEVEAPDGYQLTGKSYTVVITPTYAADGTVSDVEISITDELGNDAEEVVNTTLSSLPSTGGVGTTIFTIAGCAIIVVAGSLLIVSRRKKAA